MEERIFESVILIARVEMKMKPEKGAGFPKKYGARERDFDLESQVFGSIG